MVAQEEFITLDLRVRFLANVSDPVVTVAVFTESGLLGGFNATPPGQEWRSYAPYEESSIEIGFPATLNPGTYTFIVEIKERSGAAVLGRSMPFRLQVEGPVAAGGIADLQTSILSLPGERDTR